MQSFVGLPLMDIRIVEVLGEDWQLRVPGEPIRTFTTRELAKRAAYQRCRQAARRGQVVQMTVVEATPGPEFEQGKTGLIYERAG